MYDYIWSEIKGKRDFKKHTFKTMKQEIDQFVDKNQKDVSSEEILEWVKKLSS